MSASSVAQSGRLVLGLDIGPNSVGWALIHESNTAPVGLEALGVRVFEAGLDDLRADGRGKSRNATRRQARLARRTTERRVRRMVKIGNGLQRAGLLPPGNLRDSAERHVLLNGLDRTLGSPYALRARALDERLKPFELGWALYHLAHRRGFLSNRRTSGSDEKEEGKVRTCISDLARAMSESNCRTLGEYLSRIDPHTERVRNRYTSRQMYEDEFELICRTQVEYHPEVLTDDFRKLLHSAIFYQRPLKSQARFIGTCEFEEGRRRAPWALLSAQRFRYLQTINNLRIINTETGELIALDETQRELLTQSCEVSSELSFGRIRKLLNLKRTTKFNLELGDEKKIVGNRMGASLAAVFGEGRWLSMTSADQDSVVEDLLSIVCDKALIGRAVKKWQLSEDSASKLASVRIENGYCRLSRQALTRVLPGLLLGESLQTIVRREYPERWERQTRPLDSLPPLKESGLSELRNPIVERALTEVRRVVNAIVVGWGKPDRIQIELGRELRQTAKQRLETTKRMRANERARKDAADRLLREAGIDQPSRDDIEKVLLADECDWTCPYSGRSFDFAELFGPHPQYHVEHIIPRDRSLDDSFLNKTLCHESENRQKADRTPWEAYHSTDHWESIVERVKSFKGRTAQIKLRRFLMTSDQLREELADFTSRQLNDMRWTSRWAKQYLGLLYGGIKEDGIDKAGKRRLIATTGPVTALLRRVWGLNGMLGDAEMKSRDDHRHHAVDAVTVALSSASWIKRISDANRKGRQRGREFAAVEHPWGGFHADIEAAVRKCITSHRVDHRVRGALHKDTFFGPARFDESNREYVHQRVPVEHLTEKNVGAIVDPLVRKTVKARLEEVGLPPSKAFADPADHPHLRLGSGQEVAIHRVRIRANQSTLFSIGNFHRCRRVASENNHHMEMITDNDERWDAYVVTLLEAYERVLNNEPIVKRQHSTDRRFLFSLGRGDVIALDSGSNQGLYVVRTVPQSKQVRFVPINDARPLSEIPRTGMTGYPESLRTRNCRKMTVSILGDVRNAND